MKNSVVILLCCILNACASIPADDQGIKPIRISNSVQDMTDDKDKPFIQFPQPDNYSICHNHTCAKFAFISLNNRQWQSVKSIFHPIANNAEQERGQIKQAVALMEQLTGEQAGTSIDRAENDVSQGVNGQTDCIDEATNTTVYLRLFQNDGLLHFHKQDQRTTRGFLFAPHTTATMTDTESNTRYAIDSWFYSNGEQPVVVPLKQWESGWKPEDK